MSINRDAKKSLYALNIKSSEKGINYALYYCYRYYQKTQLFKCKSYVIKYENKKAVERFNFKSDIELISYIDEEYKKY